jgi:RNA polymerase sigma-70 factor, ECF subfamily
MASDAPQPVTVLLQQWRDGDPQALETLTPIVYDELRRLAAKFLAKESNAKTLQPTALLHEVYLKLANQRDQNWQSRAHFFGIAAHLMRLVLVDHARLKHRAKRGGGEINIPLDDAMAASFSRPPNLVALDDALTELAKFDARKSQVIEMRYFGGMSLEETAEALNISITTLGREQRLAQAWLKRYLSGDTLTVE